MFFGRRWDRMSFRLGLENIEAKRFWTYRRFPEDKPVSAANVIQDRGGDHPFSGDFSVSIYLKELYGFYGRK
jgi:hypothetical protein